MHSPAFSQETASALSFYNTGESLVEKNPDKAFQALEKAMDLSRKNKDWELYIKSLNSLASLKSTAQGEQKIKIFDWLKEAAKVLKNQRETEQLALFHYNVASYYNDLASEIEAPIQHYETAKRIWSSLKGEWNEQIANCYHGLGDINKYVKGDFLEAEKCFEKALHIRERIKLDDVRVLTRNYYSLATTNNSQQDFEKALAYGIKALEFSKKSKDPIFVEMSNAMLAGIYRDVGEFALAKRYFLNAIELNKKTNDPGTLAWYYQGLGATLYDYKLFDEALENFSKAYTLYKSNSMDDKLLFVDLLQLTSRTYLLVKSNPNYETAFLKTIRELFGKLEKFDMLQDRRAAHAYVTMGSYHEQKLRYDSALYYYQRALMASVKTFRSLDIYDNPSESMVGSDFTYEVLAIKASTFKKFFFQTKNVKYLQHSLRCLILSEKLLSKNRNTMDMEDSKWKFLEMNYDIYEELLSSLYEGLKMNKHDSLYQLAFQYFEQSKSRSLSDALAVAERSRIIGSHDSLFHLHTELKVKLFNVQDKMNEESEKEGNAANIETLTKLRGEVVELDRRIQECKLAIEEKYPGYFNVKYGYTLPTLAQIQNLLEKDNRVLLEYFWGYESVYALGINENQIIFKKIGVSDSIQSVVNSMSSHFSENYSSMSREVFHNFTESTNELYSILVNPFTSLLTESKRIQIIPDGPIGQIPFEILLKEKVNQGPVNYRSLSYLIKDFSIGYAYSSTMLFHKSSRVKHNPSLLAIGFTGGQALRNSVPLEDIEGAELELAALSKRFADGKFLVSEDATESNFKTLAPQYDIIHLAIHGRGNVDKNFSASLFFRENYDSIEDGELHAYELYALKLKASMAVLTSCESGLGKGYKGEGMLSMASAFTYSGCQNILMSLWKVNDQASIGLMDNYYEYLLEGRTIDDAMRLAKLKYLEAADELSADPKVWAPLIAYGSLDNIFPEDRSKEIALTAVILIISLLLFYVFFKRKYR